MKYRRIILSIAIVFLVSCSSTTTKTETDPIFTSEELLLLTAFSEQFGADFFISQSKCVEAVNRGEIDYCIFPFAVEIVQKMELENIFPGTAFYLIDIGSWRTDKGLAANQTQGGNSSRAIIGWMNEKVYFLKDFNNLLKANEITIDETNYENIAQALALMSIPNYLGGEVRFIEWLPVEPGEYRRNYTHSLRAWTQIWGCEINWWYVFRDAKISVVTIRGDKCRSSQYGEYIKDNQYFRFGDEGVLQGAPPALQDYNFNQ